MKRKYIFLIAMLFSAIGSRAQILNPVKWSFAAKKIDHSTAVVYLRAVIENGWHIYSTKQPPGGPVKTSFLFNTSGDYKTIGICREPLPQTHFEKVFAINVFYFEHSVIFQQKIKLSKSPTIVKGTLSYMVCNASKCLPPDDLNFEIPIN